MIPPRFLELVRHMMAKRSTEPHRRRPASEITLSVRREEARRRRHNP